ncbi:Asp-tRNA(Asn)/Glu-tRNA(Gln) amidotransferase subunit GatB [candidate division KSB1 bacterium]|nr:Asp-tRNA(Asn)/Glu-tRNA(Gln) amidotransferase subunit GatB [candidate division KSB1 bacterium]
MIYEPVIGLEVHIQLLTESKIFCSCSTRFGAEPNSQVCPVCLGMPGVLPVLNKKVVEYALKLAIATNSKINHRSIIARKNYFYPDLPKGYQISQYEEPFCEFGSIEIQVDGRESRKIGLTRIHMEEDAGKSMHSESYVSENESLVDVNRCGVPLLEIVSEPDFRSSKEVSAYLTRLRQIVRYLGICDGNMEEGSLRCDANISIRPQGQKELGVKTELKNMNSISAVEKALDYEIKRQIAVLDDGGIIQQQTLLWNANKNIVEPMRSKEYAHDYRYFPEPDLLPIVITEEWIEQIRAKMPELPLVKKQRFMSEYQIPEYDAIVLTDDPSVADYFESVAKKVKDKKAASNWVMGEVLRALKEINCDIKEFSLTPDSLAEIIQLVEEDKINLKIGKKVFEECLSTGASPSKIIKEKGLVQISDKSEIYAIVDDILTKNPEEVNLYLQGKEKLLGFFVGQIMRETQGKANPKTVNEVLKQKLNDRKN